MENYHDSFHSLRNNPAVIFILGFAAIIFIGATLLNLPIASQNSKSIGFIDALFTATSCVCVTGLVVVNTASHWTIFGKIIIIILIQIGGLGIMTMSALISFFLGKKISLKTRLLIREERNTDTLQGVVKLTKYIILSTFIIEFVGAFLLSFVFIKDFGIVTGIGYSIFHAISSFCNAGFDLIGDSLIRYVGNPLINFTIGMLIILGGIGFFVLWEVIAIRKIRRISLHAKLVLIITGILVLVGAVLFFFLEFNNPETIKYLSFWDKIQASIFQSITTRTAGYNSIDIGAMNMSTTAIMVILMFIGGSPGSTAGGIKTTTFGVLSMSIYTLIKGKRDIEVFMRRVPTATVLKSIAIMGLAFTMVMFVTLVLTVTEIGTGYDFLDLLFETVSGFGTVGLTRGLTPFLSGIGKILLSCTMFVGRLGPLTIAYALIQEKPKNAGNYTFPEGKIIVG